MKETVYIETSVVSYFTSKPGRDLVQMKSKIISVVEKYGYPCPIICSPEELLGE